MRIHGHRVSFHAINEHFRKNAFIFISRLAKHCTGAHNTREASSKPSQTTWYCDVNTQSNSTSNIDKQRTNRADLPSTDYCKAIKIACHGIRQMAMNGDMKGEFRISPHTDVLNSPAASLDALNQANDENTVFEGTGILLKRFVSRLCTFPLEIPTRPGLEHEQATVFMERFQQQLNSLEDDVKDSVMEVLITCGEVFIQDDIGALVAFDKSCITMLCDNIAVIPVSDITADFSQYVLGRETKAAFIEYCKNLASDRAEGKAAIPT